MSVAQLDQHAPTAVEGAKSAEKTEIAEATKSPQASIGAEVKEVRPAPRPNCAPF
jgi:hypothetical protein